jgi:PadR family transcriptional regulator, regulatory protein PadR
MRNVFIQKWDSQVRKGILELIILLVLSGKERYGYELIQDLKASTDFDVAEGTIYPLLNRLKNEELIESYWKEMETGIPRKYYTITEKGKDTLEEMKLYWQNLSFNIQRLILKK